MSLEELVLQAPQQQRAIDELIKEGYILQEPTQASILPRRLSESSVWGKDFRRSLKEETVRRDSDEDRVEDPSTPPESVPSTILVLEIPDTFPIPWNSGKILPRSEYEAAEVYISQRNREDKDAVVITGQPGIGKTYFLFWLLMRRLALQLPTILQVERDIVLLFHGGGVHQFAFPDSVVACASLQSTPHRKIWALVDSNTRLKEPPGMSTDWSPFFVVQAASPHPDRVEWTNKVASTPFYMKRWSFAEPLFPWAQPPFTERQLWYLHHEFGAAPRDLALHGNDPTSYEDRIHESLQRVTASALRGTIYSPTFDGVLTVMDPSPDSRQRCEKTIASRRVLKLLWDKHLAIQAGGRHVYNLLMGSAAPANAVGWLSELEMHCMLRRRQTLRLFPIRGRHVDTITHYDDYSASEGGDAIELQLPESDEFGLEAAEESLLVGRYYRPGAQNFAMADSLFLIPTDSQPILLVFHIARNKKEHHVNISSMEEIKRLAPGALVYYVIITSEGLTPTVMILKAYFSDPETPPDMVFRVFHLPIADEVFRHLQRSN